ncbi:MAG TPA: PIG-L family deacetylase [Candidatus Binatia bacterium]|nr:PIG-L family deacetylase [Candidatus Binatia bacterium]
MTRVQRTSAVLALGALVFLAACGREPAGSSTAGADVAPEPSAGCRAAVLPALHGERRSVRVGAEAREYVVDAPAGRGDRPLPVVLDFHGFRGNAERERAATGFGRLAARDGFIAVAPEGHAGVRLLGTTGTGWSMVPSDTRDVDFVRALLDRLERDRCVDRRRVFATGMSNGGFFVNLLGCVLGDRLAAVAPVAGARALDGCVPAGPMPVLLLSGRHDRVVSPEFVRGARDWWAHENACGAATADGGCQRFTGCRADVVACEGWQGHWWPSDASERIWRFFRAHPRRGPAAARPPEPLALGPAERLVVVAPHPDDETLGAGGLVQRVLAQGGSVRVVLLTAGDGYVEGVEHETGRPRARPAEFVAYGERRLGEERAALRVLGGDRIRLEFLGFPDGGLEPLLTAHWQRLHPERSPTTGATDPPYDAEAREPDLPYDGADLRAELSRVLREADPTLVVLPDPLDRHPDHRAGALFTLLALGDWRPQGPLPRLLAYLVHWPDWPPAWNAVTPPPDATEQPLLLPASLPTRGLARTVLTLTDAEVARTQAALAAYVTQQDVMRPLLAAFERRTEPFTVLRSDALARTGGMIERGRR